MKKLILLIRVLFKCGKVGNAEKSNSAVGDTGTLVTLAIGLAAAAGLFAAGGYAAEHAAQLGSANAVFSTVMTAAGIAAFFLTMMNAVNQLYISSDLDVLITLPFTPMQIVTAKIVSISVYPALTCLGLIIPAAIGYSIKADTLPAMFIPAMIIGAILLTVYVVSLVAGLLMVVMRAFRFVRSRNMLSVISTLVIFALTMVYVLASSDSGELGEEKMLGLFNTLSGYAAGMGFVFPTIGFTVDAAFGQLTGLLYAAAATACALVVMALLARTIYLSAALGMTDANGRRERISTAGMKKRTAKYSLRKTLMRHEIMQILRTPAMITNGYLYSIVVPFVIVIPMIVKIAEQIKTVSAESGMVLTLADIRQLIEGLNISPMLLVFAGALLSLIMAALSVSLSCLSRFLISREGKDFALLKTMPVRGRDLVFVKRNVALLFNGISGLIIPAVLYIALAVCGMVPAWVSILDVIVSFAWMLMFVDICAAADVAKPNLNWETETAVTKNNSTGLIILIVSFAAVIGLGILMSDVYGTVSSADVIGGAALCAVSVAGAVICELRLSKLADRLF